jgi:hypothetical protein
MPKIDLFKTEDIPAGKISMRLSALREFGGDLRNQYDSPRFDQPKWWRSRMENGHRRTRKDFRINGNHDYKPWQYISPSTIKKDFYQDPFSEEKFIRRLYDYERSVLLGQA